MVMLFSMMDGEHEVPCAVSNLAMDEMDHVAWTTPDRREEQFLRWRDRIEQRATRKFLAGAFEGKPPASFYAAWIFANRLFAISPFAISLFCHQSWAALR